MANDKNIELVIYGGEGHKKVADTVAEGTMDGIEKLLAKIVAQTKALAHVGVYKGGKVGGALRRSYGWKSSRQNKSNLAISAIGIEGYCGSNLYYAPYEEFGTRYRGAHPHFRPAIALYAYGKGKQEVKEQINEAMAGNNFKESSKVVFF